MTETSKFKFAAGKTGALWGELGPTILFVVIYNIALRMGDPETALYWATGALMISTFLIVAIKLYRKNKIPPFLIISSTLIGGFGVTGIVWQSKTFLLVMPTFINGLYAALIFGGLTVGRNIWKMLFGGLFDLPDHVWRVLAIRWGLFFVFLAVLNEVLWRNFTEEFWANFKIANMFITAAFGLAQVPITLKYLGKDNDWRPS